MSEEKPTEALPEGASVSPERARDIAFGERLKAILANKGQRRTPDNLESLDLLVELDEPELLIKVLRKIAHDRARGSRTWGAIYDNLSFVEEALEVANRPQRT